MCFKISHMMTALDIVIATVLLSCGLPDPVDLLKEPKTETSSEGIKVLVSCTNDYKQYGLNFYYYIYNADDDSSAGLVHNQKIQTILTSTAAVDVTASSAAYSLSKSENFALVLTSDVFTMDLLSLNPPLALRQLGDPLITEERSLVINSSSPINFLKLINSVSSSQEYILVRLDQSRFYRDRIVEQLNTVEPNLQPLDIRNRNLDTNKPFYVSFFIASSALTFVSGPVTLYSIPVGFGFFKIPEVDPS